MKNGNINPIKASLLTLAGTACLSLSTTAISAVVCGQVIRDIQTMDSDLYCTQSPAIIVGHGGVLNMDSHTLECDGDGIGVQLVESHAMVVGEYISLGGGIGTIQNCNIGVAMTEVGHHQASDLILTGHNTVGLSFEAAFSSAYDIVSENNPGMGVRFITGHYYYPEGHYNILANAEVNNNNLQGVRMISSYNMVRNIVVNNNLGIGISIEDGGDGNMILNSSLDSNGANGISRRREDQVDNVIAFNSVSNSEGPDITDFTAYCAGALYGANSFLNSNQYWCIH
ncbi:hypothetical protein ACJJIK_19205 [Microbulbifer sp. ZKSA006]|uniref:hypothetical protein n=1 Tax=Microbulbifer sp. ZKSA006 TaxID=3243390 RepID=UPI00403A3A84